MHLPWTRWEIHLLSAFESAELTTAEDKLMEIRNDRRLKLKHSSTDMVSFCFSPIGEPHHYKDGNGSTPSFLYIIFVWGWILCREHDEEQEQVTASNTGGGHEGMLVNQLTLDKGHHETSPSTSFQLIFYAYIQTFYFYSCLYKKILTLFILILNRKN
jgi:hypothetical protein